MFVRRSRICGAFVEMLRRKLFRKVALIPLFFVLIAVKWSYLMPPAFPDTPTDKLMFLNLTVPFNNLLLPNVSDWSFRAVKIVAFVISMPKLAGRRRAIRNTWASRNHSKTLADGQGLVLFVLSSPKFEHERRALLQEQLLYNDLIVTDIHETYRNLVLKVYVALLFFVKHFQKAEFLLKVDDDVTVLLDTMLKHWNKNVLGSDVVYCKLWNTHGPIRNRLSKWYIPVSIWSDSLYPSYCDGPLYLLGREAANRIAQNAANFKPFPFEDVFFTGIVGSYSGTKKFNWSGELTTTEPVSAKYFIFFFKK
ncbi:hypothetical protein Q1695_002592 [Nippostrongylus brasiliensis]|nr:hypothetical protein Q1695_002592 [Nippostrongylus brasiliensis]